MSATSPTSDVESHISLEHLREKYGKPEDKYVDIDGVEVHYRDEGEGPAVLLIHGSSCSLRSYDAVAALLKSKYRVVRYDHPPTGLSGSVSDDALKHLVPTDIPARLLQALDISKVSVAGVSHGGTNALFLAADYPDMVERVVVSCAPSDPVDLSAVDFGPSLTQAQSKYGEYLDPSRIKPRDYWRTYFNFYAGKPERITDETIQLTYDFARRAPEQNATSLMAKVADQDKAIDLWGRVRAPTLLLWGGSDALLPSSAADSLERRLTHSMVSKIILSDVGHYPPIEVPNVFAEYLDLYIRSVPADGLGDTPPPSAR